LGDDLARFFRAALIQVGVGGFELQDETGQTLRKGVVQFARHALAFGGDGQVFDLGGVFGQLAVGGFEFGGQFLSLLAGFGLAAIERDVDDHKNKDGQGGDSQQNGRDGGDDLLDADESQRKVIQGSQQAAPGEAKHADCFAKQGHVNGEDDGFVGGHPADGEAEDALDKNVGCGQFGSFKDSFYLPVQQDVNNEQGGENGKLQRRVQVGIVKQRDGVHDCHDQGQEPGKQARVAFDAGQGVFRGLFWHD